MDSLRSISLRRFPGVLCLFALCLSGVGSSTIFGQTSKKRPAASPTPSPVSTPASTLAIPEVVATVDGVAIHRNEIEGAVQATLADKGRTLQSISDDDRARAYRTVLDHAVVSQLLSAKATNESITEITVDQKFKALADLYQDPKAFDAELKKSGQTPDRLRESIRRQLAQQQWVEHQIAEQIKVTPQEVEKFYKEGPPANFAAPEAMRASHILVAVRKDAPPEDALDAEQKINGLLARIKKGESFDEIAKQSSDDPRTKANGGDIGYVTRDRIMPEFFDTAWRLKPGQVSDPVRTQLGYHLIKVVDRRTAHTATLDEAREQIINYLNSAKRQAAIATLIQGLRDQAKIEIFLP